MSAPISRDSRVIRPSESYSNFGQWIRGGAGYGINGAITWMTIPGVERSLALSGPINFANTWQLYGFHPNGLHTSMCDGSVRFLPEDTSREIVFALGTRTDAVLE